jgi:CNT family concentrative nucleoside transporter
VAWLIGVPWDEAGKAGWLLGVKLTLTEFVAFIELGNSGRRYERAHAHADDLCPVRLRQYRFGRHHGYGPVGAGAGSPRGGLGMVWKALFAGFLATLMSACHRRGPAGASVFAIRKETRMKLYTP